MFFLGVAGFAGSILGALILFWLSGGGSDESTANWIRVVLGLDSPIYLFVFPVIGAILPALWTLMFKPQGFGAIEGMLVGLLSFVTFCVLLAFAGPGFKEAIMGYLIFGSLFVGWVQLAIGAYAGLRYNKSFKADAVNGAA